MPTKPTIFLDMDGVLVDFMYGVHEANGVPFDIFRYPYPLGVWDVFDHSPFNFKAASAACTEDFWAKLPWMYDGPDIKGYLQTIAEPADIMLISSPMPHIGSYAGKIRWVQKHVPELAKRCIITETSKGEFAREDSVLIDDRDRNIDEWNEAGGMGILVPRPWNRRHAEFSTASDSVTFIKAGLKEFEFRRRLFLGHNQSKTLSATLASWRN